MIEAGVAAASGRPGSRRTSARGRERGGWKAWADHRGQLGGGGLGGERVGEKEEDGAAGERGREGEGGEEEEKKKRGVINPLTS